MPMRLLLSCALAGVAVPADAVAAAAVLVIVQRDEIPPRDLLAQSLREAVTRLGHKGGFSADPRLRIGMPPALRDAERLLRRLGADKETETFILAMNETAEALAARAEPLLLGAIRAADLATLAGMGPDSPLTQALRQSQESALLEQLTPLARRLIQGELIERVYRRVVRQSARFGYLRGAAPPLEQYLAQQTLDGLFAAMAEAERRRSIPRTTL